MNTSPTRPLRTSQPMHAGSGPRRRHTSHRLTGRVRGTVVALLTVPVPVLGLALAGPAVAATPTNASHPDPAGPVTADEATAVAARIDRFMNAQIKDSAIPGASVAVVRGNQVLLVRGYGHDSTGAPVTADSLFRVASLSKSFTALAVMQLVEGGRLSLDDPVQQHLPQFQLDDPRAAQITVRELLDQTSGLNDTMVPDLGRTQPRTTQEATTSLRTAHLATAPGTTYSYHNPNYQVAARLVEQVSGEPFDGYLRRHVFGPAQMPATASTAMDDEAVTGLPDGHVTAYGHAFSVPGMGNFTVGDGGVVSSAADMARWLIVNTNAGQAADGTALVSTSGLETLHTASAPKSGYALGWETRGPAASPTRLEHSGSLFTYTAEQAVWPRTHYGVVLLFNAGSPMMLDQISITHGVFDIVEGATPPTAGPHVTSRVDTVLAVLSLAVLALGVSGTVRARRWARRRGTPVRRVLTLLPAAVVLLAAAAFPTFVEALLGRDVTWMAGLYTWPALVVFVLAAASAAAATVLARIWAWTRTSHVDASSRDHRSSPLARVPASTLAGSAANS